jgi:SWI/SNF-related matrix-associated actin-dependent regulator 1 of chromatin subfamily A
MAERQEIKETLRQKMPRKGKTSVRSQVDVVLTTFSYFSSEKSDDRSFLRKFDWNYVS